MKRPRKKPAATTAATKKPSRTTTKKAPAARAKAATSRPRKTRAAARVAASAPTPVETMPAPPAPLPTIAPEAVVVTSIPEPAFAARVPPPEPPRPRPSIRRGIFFDVENTSRAEDIGRVLSHLDIDWLGVSTEFMAIGNWRVIGHDTARLLAVRGAKLVHSAPSAGVRDWSDLRIAVSAGVWLASAQPGDVVEIVSDDQAFDAVGDVATSLGVAFRRTSYRALAGLPGIALPEEQERPRRSRRGGRRPYGERERPEPRGRGERPERPHRPAVAAHAEPRPAATVHRAAAPAAPAEPHTAPHDEIVEVVRELVQTSPAGISLDALANELKARGFSRPPGSPRLITRLRRIRELEVSRNGLIRLVEAVDAGHGRRAPRELPHTGAAGGVAEPTPAEPAAAAPSPAVAGEVPRAAVPAVVAIEPPHAPLHADDLDVDPWAEEEEAFRAWTEGRLGEGTRAVAAADEHAVADEDELGEGEEGELDEPGGDVEAAGGEASSRRRRRRGGRRRRGRRGGAGATTAPAGV